LAGVDNDLDLTGPARPDFVEALITRGRQPNFEESMT